MMLPYSLYHRHNNLYMKSIRKKVIEWGLSNYVNDIYCIVKNLGIEEKLTHGYLIIHELLNNLDEFEEYIANNNHALRYKLKILFSDTLIERKCNSSIETIDKLEKHMKNTHYKDIKKMIDAVFRRRVGSKNMFQI